VSGRLTVEDPVAGCVVQDEILQIGEVQPHVVHAARVDVGQVHLVAGLLVLVLLFLSVHIQQGRRVQGQVVKLLEVLTSIKYGFKNLNELHFQKVMDPLSNNLNHRIIIVYY
jgi:hypothetical protein